MLKSALEKSRQISQSPDFFQVPGDSTLITSEALPLLPAHLRSQAVPVSVLAGQQPLSAGLLQSQPGSGPLASATHRPRYQAVTPEDPPQPDYEDILDEEDLDSVDSDSLADSQKLSEDQSYREHVKAVRHFMGWEVPDVDPPVGEPSNPL